MNYENHIESLSNFCFGPDIRLRNCGSMELTDKAFFGRLLREGNAEMVSKTYGNAMPQFVSSIHGDNELRSARMADLALSSARLFYICTKTDFPTEIVEIMNKVRPRPCEILDP